MVWPFIILWARQTSNNGRGHGSCEDSIDLDERVGPQHSVYSSVWGPETTNIYFRLHRYMLRDDGGQDDDERVTTEHVLKAMQAIE